MGRMASIRVLAIATIAMAALSIWVVPRAHNRDPHDLPRTTSCLDFFGDSATTFIVCAWPAAVATTSGQEIELAPARKSRSTIRRQPRMSTPIAAIVLNLERLFLIFAATPSSVYVYKRPHRHMPAAFAWILRCILFRIPKKRTQR